MDRIHDYLEIYIEMIKKLEDNIDQSLHDVGNEKMSEQTSLKQLLV